MSELPEGIPAAEVPDPHESASGVVLVRGNDGRWEVLLGLRSRKARFMPGHLSCPGGRVDPVDRVEQADRYRRCVRRELHEEVGLDIPVEQWIAAGERTTPPMFPLRFRTRFFVTRLPDGASRPALVPASSENESLRLAPARVFLDEWARGDARLPPPIVPLLRALDRAEDRPEADVASAIAAANAQEERAPRIEFVPDVWMLPVRTVTMPPATHTNVWMPGGKRFAIIDPGSDEAGELERLIEVIERRRRETAEEPAVVLLTHHHRDHISGAAQLARTLGLPIRAHAAALRQVPETGCEVEPLSNGEDLDLGGLTLRAVHTPGHANGHLAFHLRERGILIVGDLVSGLSTILIDPPDGDMTSYLDSLEIVEDLQCDLLLPGHGPPLPGSRLQRLRRHRLERERLVAQALGVEPLELSEIARDAYAETPDLPEPLVHAQTRAHLVRLERLGRAIREEDGSTRTWRAGRMS